MIKKTEAITYSLGGVHITALFDYDRGSVSFVRYETSIDGFQPQSFTFANRTREYLGGWIKILKALEIVTELADQNLQEQQELREARKNEEYINIWGEISKSKEDEK